MDNYDLKKIKKHYGERFAKLCRELFPTFLDKEGLLFNTIYNIIEPNSTIYDDINNCKEEFANYIYSLIGTSNKTVITDKSPEELFDEAGYVLMPECQTKEDLLSYKDYYYPGEMLCSFFGERLDSCRVWFAIKKNVNAIYREDYYHPVREDEYGTSVLSIQFTRGALSRLSIKNRYNHSVNNPDATFNNNLDEIIPGLTYAFCKKYNIELYTSQKNFFRVSLKNYVCANNEKLYKYYFYDFSDNIYYCENNIIIDNGKVKKFNKDKYIVADNYIIDLENKTIKDYLTKQPISDKTLQNIESIKTQNIIEDNKKITLINIYSKNSIIPVEIKLRKNEIVSYSNENATFIGNDFLANNKKLTNIYLPNVVTIGNKFLSRNEELKTLTLQNVVTVGDEFLYWNNKLEEFNASNIEEIGNFSLCSIRRNVCKNGLKKLKKLGVISLPCIGLPTEYEMQ